MAHGQALLFRTLAHDPPLSPTPPSPPPSLSHMAGCAVPAGSGRAGLVLGGGELGGVELVEMKITDLQPDEHNANKGTQRGLTALDNSLRKYGAGRSILIDKNNKIIAGNKTTERAVDIGLDEVIVVETDGSKLVAVKRTDLDLETDKEARELAYYDNRVAQLDLDWDIPTLEFDLAQGLDLDGLFSEFDLKDLGVNTGANGEADAEPQLDRAAELQEVWQVQKGELFEIGAHRLICGDCTDAATVARLMRGEKARLVWTDPPYGVNYGEKIGSANPMGYRVRTIENDDLPADKLEEFIRSALKLAAIHATPGASIYVASPAGTLLPTLIASFVGSGFDYRWCLIWVKDQIVLSRGDYHFKHENILYGWKPDAVHYFTKDRTQSSVFEYPRPKVSEEHPTMKPIELIQHMLENSSERGDIVYDGFGGSGSTGIAAENLGRRARLVEISQAYCAVILQRFTDAFPGIEIRRFPV